MKINKQETQYWSILLAVALSIKLAIYFLDSAPMFFLGDSEVYINTALRGWIPPDRSFVYGYIIRLIAVTTHSLQNLVLLQTILGALTAVLAAYILKSFFAVSHRWAFGAAVLCTIEPLQLFYERYVMTETVTLFIFAILVAMILRYIRKPTIPRIIITQLLGLMLISMRMVYLPLVLVMTVALPLFTFLKEYFNDRNVSNKRILLTALSHLLIAITCMSILHSSYRHLVGHLLHRQPAYIYNSGFSLLMCWAPIIEPEDFGGNLGYKIFARLTQNPKNRKKRGAQLCWRGGLKDVITTLIPDPLKAEQVAKNAAIHAAINNPTALLSLYWHTIKDYWTIGYIKGVMRFDRGSTRPLSLKFQKELLQNFRLHSARQPYITTLTNWYFFKAWPWYLFILLTPLLALINLIFAPPLRLYSSVVFLLSCFLVTIPATFPAVRYMHPLGWLSIIVLIPLLSRLTRSHGYYSGINKLRG